MLTIPHQDTVQLSHSFDQAWTYLNNKGDVNLTTSKGTNFRACSRIAQDNHKVIIFFQKGREYARAYKCCWGHYYNCNRTRFGMYAKALDKVIEE